MKSCSVIGVIKEIGGTEVDGGCEATVGFGGGVVEGGTFGGEGGWSGVFVLVS